MAASLFAAKPKDSDIRRGMRISLTEAAVVGAMFAATETWLVPLLQQRLGAAAHVIGLLTIIPQLGVLSIGAIARPLIQALGGNRRTAVMVGATQTVLLGLLQIPLWWHGMAHAVDVALALCIAIGLTGAVNGPAWNAWMGDLIPRTMMGRYQVWRTRIFVSLKLAWGIGFALLLDHYPPTVQVVGLSSVFAVAALSRLGSTLLLARQPQPKPRPIWRGPQSNSYTSSTITVMDFVRGLPKTEIGRWTLVWAVFFFAVCVSSPFTASYMLTPVEHGGLGLRPHPYWLLGNVQVVARLLMVPLVGRAIDLFGPRAVLRVGIIGITLGLVAWVFVGNVYYLGLNEVLAGTSWCCAETAVGVLLFSCNRDPLQRVRLIGYYQMVVGTAVILGTMLGKELLQLNLLPPFSGSVFKTLFLISIVLRLPGVLLAILWLPRLRPLKDHETAGLWRLIPGSGVTITIGRGLIGVFRRPGW